MALTKLDFMFFIEEEGWHQILPLNSEITKPACQGGTLRRACRLQHGCFTKAIRAPWRLHRAEACLSLRGWICVCGEMERTKDRERESAANFMLTGHFQAVQEQMAQFGLWFIRPFSRWAGLRSNTKYTPRGKEKLRVTVLFLIPAEELFSQSCFFLSIKYHSFSHCSGLSTLVRHFLLLTEAPVYPIRSCLNQPIISLQFNAVLSADVS